VTPEEELEQLKANHEELKAAVATLEAKADKQTPPPVRHMAFPTGGDSALGFGAGNVVFDRSEFDKLVKDPIPPKAEDVSFDDLQLAAMICKANPNIGELTGNYADRLDGICKDKFGASFYTMTTGGTGTGAELTERAITASLFKDVTLAAKVARGFSPIVNMPTSPFDLPVMGDVSFKKPAGEGQAVTATDLATAKRTLTAYTVKGQVDVSDELNQDSIIALIPAIRARLVENAAKEIDMLILLADSATAATTNINHHDGTPSGDESWLLGFEGIFKYCLVTNTGQGASLTALEITDFGALLALLDGKYIVDPSRLMFVSDPWTYLKAVQLSDFRTVDKLGDKATLLTGQLGAVYGIPYIATDAVGKACADGMVDVDTPAGNTTGRIALIHRDMWKVGVRKPVRVATERSEAKGLTSLVVSFRLALMSFNASGKYSSLGYNITV